MALLVPILGICFCHGLAIVTWLGPDRGVHSSARLVGQPSRAYPAIPLGVGLAIGRLVGHLWAL